MFKTQSFTHIIVGLGNPGSKYETTRHNIGFITIDRFAQLHGCKINKIRFKSLIGDCRIGDSRVLLMKPSTFMNASGEAVTEAMRFYKIPPEHVIVFSDDISLDLGKLRIRRKGSDGGQKGLRSIIYLSGSEDIPRVKLGVGAKPSPEWDLADWVLSRFTPSEIKLLEPVIDNACDAAELIVRGDIEKAMSLYN